MSENDDRLKIAERIRSARQLAGLSQGQVAKMLGLHRPSVSEIEAGKRNVSATELAQMAEIFDVSMNYLMAQAPDTLSPDDPRLQLAARELAKLPPDALTSLMKALAAVQGDQSDKDGKK